MARQVRVVLHEFGPSGRRVWTVSAGREYWADPDAGFCSCPGFYFARPRRCYHLDSLKEAAGRGDYRRVLFGDDEYPGFMEALAGDMLASGRREGRG